MVARKGRHPRDEPTISRSGANSTKNTISIKCLSFGFSLHICDVGDVGQGGGECKGMEGKRMTGVACAHIRDMRRRYGAQLRDTRRGGAAYNPSDWTEVRPERVQNALGIQSGTMGGLNGGLNAWSYLRCVRVTCSRGRYQLKCKRSLDCKGQHKHSPSRDGDIA